MTAPNPEPKADSWTNEERDGIRNLLRMAAILFIAIVIAGIVAALISSALGTL